MWFTHPQAFAVYMCTQPHPLPCMWKRRGKKREEEDKEAEEKEEQLEIQGHWYYFRPRPHFQRTEQF